MPTPDTLRFAYPARLTPGPDGRLTVSFRDLPEALTDGADRAEALAEAADALDEALAGRIVDNEAIPVASPVRRGEIEVAVPAVTAAKAALYETARRAGLTKAGLAKALAVDEKEGRRLLDPAHPTKLARLTRALDALSSSLVLELATPLPAPDPGLTAAQIRKVLEEKGYVVAKIGGKTVFAPPEPSSARPRRRRAARKPARVRDSTET